MSPLDKLFLQRLRSFLAMSERLELLPKLQERIAQKLAELRACCEQTKDENQQSAVTAILERNDAKMRTIGNKAMRIGNRINSAVGKMEAVRSKSAERLSPVQEKRLTRAINRGLKTLELSQSLLEMQLLDLDGITDEIDHALGGQKLAN